MLLFTVADFLHDVVGTVFYGVEDLGNVFAQDSDPEQVHASERDNAEQQTGPTRRQIHAEDEVPEKSEEEIKKKWQRRADSDDVGKSQWCAGKTGKAIDGEPQHLGQIKLGSSGQTFRAIVFYPSSAKADPADHAAQVHDLVAHGE